MDQLKIGQHISRQFTEELEIVRSKVMAMGGLVEEQLADAIQALVEGDGTLATKVVAGDQPINALEIEIDEECTQILARRQPAASDLRLITTIIKVIADLERIGDEAERIGRMAEFMAGRNFDPHSLAEVERMGEIVRHMLRDCLHAFARTDMATAIEIMERDHAVDEAYEDITRRMVSHMTAESDQVQDALNILWSVRSLERIGDRSRNVCEYVIYLARGKNVRHTDIDQVLGSMEESPPGDSD